MWRIKSPGSMRFDIFDKDCLPGQIRTSFRCLKKCPKWHILMVLPYFVILLVACSILPKIETHNTLSEYLNVSGTATPTITPNFTNALPSQTPSISPTPILLVYSGEVYHHIKGLFEFALPDGWKLVGEQDNAAEFNNPSINNSMHVLVTNTGMVLDRASFQRFVEAQEVNLFSAYSGYVQINQQYDQVDNAASVEKHVKLNGVDQDILTLYRQSGDIILNLDIWSTESLSEEYINEFGSFFSKIQLFSEIISAQPLYGCVYEFLTDTGLYTGEIPLQWMRKKINTVTTQIDSFTSPDQQAVIQLTQYSDNEYISKADAGFIVLTLLRDEYEPGLNILEDRLPPEGGEILIWSTSPGGLKGTTTFEINGTTLIIKTSVYPTQQENLYQNLLQTITKSIHAVK
jgi:hypothetical protein